MNRFVNIFAHAVPLCYMQRVASIEGDSDLDRDSALQAARTRFENPMWAVIEQLELTLSDLSRVKHIDLADSRAVGSVLNSALSDAAVAAHLSDHGLEVTYVRDGQSNKMTGSLELMGKEHPVSFELHLSGPRGGTSKAAHQFAGRDIEREPSFPGFEVEAPTDLLFFIACHLSGTGASVERAFLKFADGVDQRMIEIHRTAPPMAADATEIAPVDGPTGARFTVKKPKGEETENGSTSDKRGDAALSS